MLSKDNSPSGDQDGSSKSSDSESGSDSRKTRSGAQWPTDKVVVTAVGEDGMPVAESEKRRMRKLAGLIARQKVSLVLTNFGCLKKKGKKELFDSWVMPYLEFNEDMYVKGFKRAMKSVAKSWRDHKSKLVNEFMLKNRSPFERFKYLKREDYAAFVELKSSEMSKKESEKFRELWEKNRHPHRLGTAGYDGKIPKWQAEDAKLAKEGLPNPWHMLPGPSQHWLRARGTLMDNGEISFKSQEIKEVSDMIKEYVEESSCNGDREDDALTRALGNKEHPGRVRQVSSYNGWKLGWPEFKKKRGLCQYDIEQLSENIRAQVTEDVIAQIPSILAAQGLKLVPISPSTNQVSPGDEHEQLRIGSTW